MMVLDSLSGRMARAPAAVRLIVGLVIAVLLQVGILIVRPRADLAVFPTWRLLLDLALLAVPAVLTLDLALRPAPDGTRPRWGVPVAVALAVVGVAGVASLPTAHGLHPASIGGVGPDLVPRALECFTVGALLTGTVVLLLRSCTSARRCPLTLMVTTAAGATIAGVGLHLHCPLTHPIHLWSGHVSVMIVALFGGWTIGRRMGSVMALNAPAPGMRPR